MSAAAATFRRQVIERVLGPAGRASQAARRAAYELGDAMPAGARALLEKVARQAWKIADDDVAAAKAAGLTEDQLFELCVCAAVGESTRQLDAALAVLP